MFSPNPCFDIQFKREYYKSGGKCQGRDKKEAAAVPRIKKARYYTGL